MILHRNNERPTSSFSVRTANASQSSNDSRSWFLNHADCRAFALAQVLLAETLLVLGCVWMNRSTQQAAICGGLIFANRTLADKLKQSEKVSRANTRQHCWINFLHFFGIFICTSFLWDEDQRSEPTQKRRFWRFAKMAGEDVALLQELKVICSFCTFRFHEFFDRLYSNCSFLV